MNLTCGRNPWKRASVEDSTFKAYLKNPKFLSSILPLSPELDSILRRIFECDPRRRIGIPELRNLILKCSRFTTCAALAPATPLDVKYFLKTAPELTVDNVNYIHQYPTVSYTPTNSSPLTSIALQYSQPTISSDSSSSSSLSSDAGSTFSTGSINSLDPCHNSTVGNKLRESLFMSPKPHFNYYGSLIPLETISKPLDPRLYFHRVQVC